MAAEDWKGVAMVLSQLGEMAKPSELDIIDKKFELESLQKKADREHQFMLKNFEIAQNQYNKLQERYKSTMTEGEGIDAELNKLKGKELNFSGEAQKVHNAIYGNQFTNYDAGIKMLNDNIDKLQNDIIAAEDINQAGKLGSQFTNDYKLKGKNYWDDAQVIRDEDGNPLTKWESDKMGEYVKTEKGDGYSLASPSQIGDTSIPKFSQVEQIDSLINDMSYNEALYAIGEASLELPEGNQRDAFVLAAEGSLKQEAEKKATSAAKAGLEPSSKEKSNEQIITDARTARSYLSQPDIDELLSIPNWKKELVNHPQYANMIDAWKDWNKGIKRAVELGKTHEIMNFTSDYFLDKVEDGVDEDGKVVASPDVAKRVTKGFSRKIGGIDMELYDKIMNDVGIYYDKDNESYALEDGTLLIDITDEEAQNRIDKGWNAKKGFHDLYHSFEEMRTLTGLNERQNARGLWNNSVQKLRRMYP